MDTSNDIYTHYGKLSYYDKSLFKPIKNRKWIKPNGGLWGSVGNSWEHWCEVNNFSTEEGTENKFYFKVTGRVLRIQKTSDIKLLYHYADKELNPFITESFNPFMLFSFIDFEKMATNYNAIEVYAENDYNIYQALYGWDVNSILVLNPDAVVEVDENGKEIKSEETGHKDICNEANP